MGSVLVLVLAVAVLFGVLPLLALHTGRRPAPPMPVLPEDVLLRRAYELHLSAAQLEEVRRCARRGQRAGDPRLREPAAEYAATTLALLRLPRQQRAARVVRVVAPVVAIVALTCGAVLTAAGRGGDGSTVLVDGVLYGAAAVGLPRLRQRRVTLLEAAVRANGGGPVVPET